jgi:hypothetical protein
MSRVQSSLGNFLFRQKADYRSTPAPGTFTPASPSPSLRAWPLCPSPGLHIPLEQANVAE